MIGLGFLVFMFLACFVGAQLRPGPERSAPRSQPTSGPSTAHWFGTDELSRDSLSRVLHGGQISLKVALGVALLSTVIGVVIGALAGFYRGWLDGLLMRFTDLWIALPAMPFLAVAVSIGTIDLGPLGDARPRRPARDHAAAVVPAVGLDRARRARRDAGAARAGVRRRCTRHRRVEHAHHRASRVPNCLGPIIVNATLVVAEAILVESTLSFLGLRHPAAHAQLGQFACRIRSARSRTGGGSPCSPASPSFSTVLAVNFVGDGLRDAFDPRRRVRA